MVALIELKTKPFFRCIYEALGEMNANQNSQLSVSGLALYDVSCMWRRTFLFLRAADRESSSRSLLVVVLRCWFGYQHVLFVLLFSAHRSTTIDK
eukprot:1196190-Prorocentrum_minimum.AAC.1